MEFNAIRDVVAAFPGTRILEANGDIFAIHDPDGTLKPEAQIPWATITTSDAYDTASNLDRPGVFRLNIGLTRDRLRELIDPAADHDPTALDVLLPHPVYGGQHWVCVLNPERTWPVVEQLLAEAHAFAARKYDNTARRRNRA